MELVCDRGRLEECLRERGSGNARSGRSIEDLAPGAHRAHLTIALEDAQRFKNYGEAVLMDAQGDEKERLLSMKLLMAKLRNPLKPWSASDAKKR